MHQVLAIKRLIILFLYRVPALYASINQRCWIMKILLSAALAGLRC